MSGSVSIDDNGNATGSGDALALYNSILAVETAANPLADPNAPDADWDDTQAAWSALVTPINVRIKRAWAREAQAHADVLSGGNVLQSLAVTGDVLIGSSVVVAPTRAGSIVLTLPASAPVGHSVDIVEVSGAVVFTVTIAPPGGESLAGFTTIAALARRTFLKWDATNWIGVA